MLHIAPNNLKMSFANFTLSIKIVKCDKVINSRDD